MTPTDTATKDLVWLCRALKAPSLASGIDRLADRARADGWTYEAFLAACLEREVLARQAHGGQARIKAARLPARKTLEDFDFDHQHSVRRDVIAHLGQLDFVAARDNVVFLPPSPPPAPARPTCQSHWASARAWPATAWRSRRRPSGSTGSAPRMPPAACTTSYAGWPATR